MNRRMIGLIAVAAIVIGLIAVTGYVGSDTEAIDLPNERHATQAENEAFLALHRQYHRMVDAARASGDVSAFPTLIIDDPGFDIAEYISGCLDRVDRYRGQIDQAIAASSHPNQPADTGILSCSIANIMYLYDSYHAWSSVKATATVEGRTPVSADLPDGLSPLDKPRAVGGFAGVYIVEAFVEGEYALVNYSYDWVPGSMHEHLLLHQLDGQWYIAGMWAEGHG